MTLDRFSHIAVHCSFRATAPSCSSVRGFEMRLQDDQYAGRAVRLQINPGDERSVYKVRQHIVAVHVLVG